MASLDIFKVLDIETREDSYSSLLVHLLEHSPNLRSHLQDLAFGPAARPDGTPKIHLRRKIGKHDIADITLQGPATANPPWIMFVEMKIYSTEHGDQTQRYWDACSTLVGTGGRVGGIFLTIEGTTPVCPHAKPLKHHDLAVWLDEHKSDFQDHPVLSLAADAYARRARAPKPSVVDTTALMTLRKPPWGLISPRASVVVLGEVVLNGLTEPKAWEFSPVWIQGKGHANPGLVFWRSGWRGTPMIDKRWTAENYNIHLELELAPEPPWSLKLHFETEPYLPQKRLKSVTGHGLYELMRKEFRRTLHAAIADVPGWKGTGHELQIAAFKIDLGPEATVAHLRDRLAPAMSAVAGRVGEALASARRRAS